MKKAEMENGSVKRIFLVDFENVHTGGLRGTKSLSEHDEIVLFYSDNDEDSIAFICELRDDIRYAKIAKNGQNALDFQLSSYLGFVIKETVFSDAIANTQFFIVSKDTGFDSVVNFWTKTAFAKFLNVSPNIRRVDSIHSALFPAVIKPVPTTPVPPKAKSSEQKKFVDGIMKSVKSLDDFHAALGKEYGMPKGGDLYKANKAKFQELKRTVK